MSAYISCTKIRSIVSCSTKFAGQNKCVNQCTIGLWWRATHQIGPSFSEPQWVFSHRVVQAPASLYSRHIRSQSSVPTALNQVPDEAFKWASLSVRSSSWAAVVNILSHQLLELVNRRVQDFLTWGGNWEGPEGCTLLEPPLFCASWRDRFSMLRVGRVYDGKRKW